MFRKTIQNIQTSRNGGGINYQGQINNPNGYNTERYDRYSAPIEQNKILHNQNSNNQLLNQQRKTISSGQFSQLASNNVNKKVQQNRPSQLIIRECDVSQLNTFKKNTPRQIEQVNSLYNYGSNVGHTNSSSKKQRIGIASRKTYDSNYKQPLQQIHYSDRDNISKGKISSDRSSGGNSFVHQTNSASSSYYQMHQQIQHLKQYIYQIHQQQSQQIKKTKNQVKSIQNQCMGQLQNFANQISKQLTKQKQDLLGINKKTIQNQRQLRYLKDSFNSFVKDNQQKIQSLVLDIHGGNVTKKSRNNEEFGVDLKSSSNCMNGGVGTSMSSTFQNDNMNLKLYNELSAQIEVLKGELEQCKQKIQGLEKDTKNIQLERKTSKQELKQPVKQKIDFREVEKLILEKFSQEKKKNQYSQKIQDLDLRTKDLYKVYQDIDSNIKGMNAQFTRVINGTVIKKQKLLETKLNATQQKLNQLSQKLVPSQFTQTLKSQVKRILQQKSLKTKIIKVRQPTQTEKNGLDSTKDRSFTYLLDQQGFLLDSEGSYIMQMSQTGGKKKIKIQKEMMYLLESQGIQIKVA